MKKLKTIIGMLLAVSMIFAFTACSDTDMNGNYKALSIKITYNDADPIEVKFSELDGTDISDLDDIKNIEDSSLKTILTVTVAMLGAIEFEIDGDQLTTKIGTLEPTSGKFRRDGNKIIPLDEDGKDSEVNIGDGAESEITFKNGKIYFSVNTEHKNPTTQASFDIEMLIIYEKV